MLRFAAAALTLLGAVLVIASLVRQDGVQRTRAPEMAPPVSIALPPAYSTGTPEPLVPTRTPSLSPSQATSTPASAVTPSVVAAPVTPNAPDGTVTPTLYASLTATAGAPTAFTVPLADRHRLGVSLAAPADRYVDLAPFRVGWTMDWRVHDSVALDEEVAFAQTVRIQSGVLGAAPARLTAVATARPGSLWLIANEPDVRWQDNVDPETFARLYHDAYTAIKAGDPSAVVAAGGIAQPTGLRLRYLDMALGNYQDRYGEPLPADAWHIHNYMLREERDGWGVDIPPGLEDNAGVLYQIEDSGNIAHFQAQIQAFRTWMANRGYAGLPLIISEFGVPMPADYGYSPQVVAAFLRDATWYMLTATDSVSGVPDDGYRLVQRWCWFNLASREYPTGNLVDVDTGGWTELGWEWLVMVGTEQ